MSDGRTGTTVFFSRCKPCGVDAIDIALKWRCVFIGYTMAKAGVAKAPGDVRNWMVDLTCPEDEWTGHRAVQTQDQRQHAKNRNLACSVKPGSIVMVPRPKHGVIYCGRVSSPYRVSYDIARSDRFLELYRAHFGRELDSDEVNWTHGEVCQGWDVDDFVAIPVPQVPAWIRRSLFGRSTYGVIKQDTGAGDPHAMLSALMIKPSFAAFHWTTEPGAVRQRLLNTVTPEIFEHLVVALLQLDQPELAWLSVGGSGDGGVDGIASDEQGRVAALLQCKWQYWGERAFGAKPLHAEARTFLAILQGARSSTSGADVLLDGDWVVEKVIEHADRLPLAMTLRVGRPSPHAAVSAQAAE